MTTEKLQKGLELEKNIERINNQLHIWKCSNEFYYARMRVRDSKNNRSFDDVDPQYIDFDVCKAIAVQRLEKELEELTKQFNEL